MNFTIGKSFGDRSALWGHVIPFEFVHSLPCFLIVSFAASKYSYQKVLCLVDVIGNESVQIISSYQPEITKLGHSRVSNYGPRVIVHLVELELEDFALSASRCPRDLG